MNCGHMSKELVKRRGKKRQISEFICEHTSELWVSKF